MQKRIGVVGGGITGLAIAYKLTERYPGIKVVLFEKEAGLGLHQSGRNSGVLHSGLYYEPGSLKARLAVSGIKQMSSFCELYKIDHEICGKVVVASDERETVFLDNLAQRGKANGLEGLKFLSNNELKSREPYVKAVKSLLVPAEGIVDYKAVMSKMAELIQQAGGDILLRSKVSTGCESKERILVSDSASQHELDMVVNCTGLHTDRTYKALTGSSKSPIKIVPFRGEYYKLLPHAEKLVNHLIYPVPDPEYPFLGIHFTRMVSGEREVGPNAVFAMKREGYSNSDISLRDTFESLTYKGFLLFLKSNFNFAMGEFSSSLFRDIFLNKAKKLIPDLTAADLEKGSAGVRAQAIDDEGKLVMDFKVIRSGRQVHLLNAPSPGATASLAIADYIISNYLNDID